MAEDVLFSSRTVNCLFSISPPEYNRTSQSVSYLSRARAAKLVGLDSARALPEPASQPAKPTTGQPVRAGAGVGSYRSNSGTKPTGEHVSLANARQMNRK